MESGGFEGPRALFRRQGHEGGVSGVGAGGSFSSFFPPNGRRKIVFLSACFEAWTATLGSWAFARTLDPLRATAVVNLESVGASDELALITEDGFALTRYHSPAWLVEWVGDAARGLWGRGLPARELPPGTLTDGRSFLAHGIPALTLRAFTPEGFPRGLHSFRDSRDRLSPAAIDRAAEFLFALVEAADADPEAFTALARR